MYILTFIAVVLGAVAADELEAPVAVSLAETTAECRPNYGSGWGYNNNWDGYDRLVGPSQLP